MRAVRLDKAGMKKVHADHQAAMGVGDVDTAMSFLAPDPEVQVAGLHLRGTDAVRANKLRWIHNWTPRPTAHGLTFEAYDEESQMAVFEAWADNAMEDGTLRRQWMIVVLEFENGLMKRERFYCLDPGMIEEIQRAVG